MVSHFSRFRHSFKKFEKWSKKKLCMLCQFHNQLSHKHIRCPADLCSLRSYWGSVKNVTESQSSRTNHAWTTLHHCVVQRNPSLVLSSMMRKNFNVYHQLSVWTAARWYIMQRQLSEWTAELHRLQAAARHTESGGGESNGKNEQKEKWQPRWPETCVKLSGSCNWPGTTCLNFGKAHSFRSQ